MKKSLIVLIIIVINMLTNSVFSQKKNKLTVTVLAENYIGQNKLNNFNQNNSYNHIPGPGVELIYMRGTFKGLEIGTGIGYHLGFMATYSDKYYQYRRFKFSDICFPVLLKKYFKISDNENFHVTAGIYFGKTTNIKAEYATRGPWYEFPDISKLENYTDDIRYSDLYFDLGYHTSLKKSFTFSIAPFFKYRINTTWLNYYQKKYHYGLKLGISLNF